MGPGDLTYPMHIEKGLGRYLQSAMNVQPDFSGINNMFSSIGSMGPLVRGGQFMDPQQTQAAATPGYLSARGGIAQNNLQNLFDLSSLQTLVGGDLGNMAAMIPALQAQQIQAKMSGASQLGNLFGGL